MNYNYMTGEPMMPPSERNNPNVDILYTLSQMPTHELEAVIKKANEFVRNRQKEEAKGIIKRVVQDLERLREMGNVVFTIECESEYMHDIFDEIINFNDVFKIREV